MVSSLPHPLQYPAALLVKVHHFFFKPLLVLSDGDAKIFCRLPRQLMEEAMLLLLRYILGRRVGAQEHTSHMALAECIC